MNNRDYVIDRLKSRKISIDEFNFEKLSAPPLAMFLSPYDIMELNNIAKSLKYSGKIQEKLQMIDAVCRRRGLVKFASGTNRVIYRHPEFNNIVFKIAYDSIGLGDNPAEFRNQHLLKPFVAKTFEISPCGTVAISERVDPIRSREEFISIADDVFTLLNDYIVGKFIVADVGTEYFLNWSVRKGFGVVLLDYTYVYELDENKIFCNKLDVNSPTGKCEGDIVYDDGFNHLYCSKCGAKYKAIELRKKIEDKELIIRGKGEQVMMKVVLRGGNGSAEAEARVREVNNDAANRIFAQPTDSIKVNSTVNVRIGSNNTDVDMPAVPKVTISKQEPVTHTEEKAVNGVIIDAAPEEVVAVEEEVVEEIPVVVEDLDEDITINPFTVDKSLIGTVEESEPVEKNPVEIIDEAVDTIVENLATIKIDAVKTDAINRMVSKIISAIPANGNSFKEVIEVAVSIFDNAEDDDYLDVVHSEKFINFVKRVFEPTVVLSDVEVNGDEIILNHYVDMNYAYDTTDKAYSTYVGGTVINDILDKLEIAPTVAAPANVEQSDNTEDDNEYKGIEFTNGMVVKASELFTNADRKDIIVATDENGNYITTKDGMIVGIDVINDCSVGSVAIVSKDWIENANNIINPKEEEETIDGSVIGVAQVDSMEE